MKSFVTYFIKYPIAANLLMFAIILMGLFAGSQLKFTFFPEVEVRVVNVTAVYPGAAPSEIEEGIVAKIEEEVKGLTGVKKIQSVSSENLGNVTITLEQGTD
ncbi:MAG: efflux RND transporter permease subunit, partial [Bacteroidia bacterium]|nr:efflux RND transporter permease subunit [Bacteroidia bacterium]